MLAAQTATAPHQLGSNKAPSTLMEPEHKAPPIAMDTNDKFMQDLMRDGVSTDVTSLNNLC